MRIHTRRKEFTVCALLTLCLAMPGICVGQRNKSLVATVQGNGTITFGAEEWKINSLVVKLSENGKAELHLISDITIFVTGRWSRTPDRKVINLEITGTVTEGRLEGGGKLLLHDDAKSVQSLNLEVMNRFTKNKIKVDFAAK